MNTVASSNLQGCLKRRNRGANVPVAVVRPDPLRFDDTLFCILDLLLEFGQPILVPTVPRGSLKELPEALQPRGFKAILVDKVSLLPDQTLERVLVFS